MEHDTKSLKTRVNRNNRTEKKRKIGDLTEWNMTKSLKTRVNRNNGTEDWGFNRREHDMDSETRVNRNNGTEGT